MSATNDTRRFISEPSDIYDASTALRSLGEDSDDDTKQNQSGYGITSIFANPSNSLIRRGNGSKTEELATVTIEQILHEYTTACQIYGCSSRINAGVLTTFRYRLPSLRVSGSFFDADMLALVEVLLQHINGPLSYIRRLDFSLAAVEGKQFGKKGIRSHGAYALAKVLEISRYIEEVFLPGKSRVNGHLLFVLYAML